MFTKKRKAINVLNTASKQKNNFYKANQVGRITRPRAQLHSKTNAVYCEFK